MAGQYFVYKFNLLRMKTRHLFTVALAALAFSACSNDDDFNNANNEPQPGEKGALVESISINFGEGFQKPETRNYGPDQKGLGTEGLIYEAFIFAKEANPLHDRALDGDWTVIRITRNAFGLVQETGGIHPEAVAKADLTDAVNDGSDKDKEWLVKNVAQFKGVRQGDYVYVIANDPNLTLAQASAMAHKGDLSEENIKAYTANISKEYLNKLTYYPETGETAKEKEPNGRFVMAGRELIPVSPTIPSNGNIDLTVGLDRELSKVNFTAIVSTDPGDLAYGKVEFQQGDGIVVARIARKTSMFTEKTGDWYVPANTCVEDWPINDHPSSCDATFKGSVIFDGESADPITDWVKDITIPAGFNATNPAGNISEYRYSWKANDVPGKKIKPIYIDAASNGKLVSPMFYVTPNYSNNTNSVTVICTQATYVDRGVFALSDLTDKHIDAVLNADKKDIVIYTPDEIKKLEGELAGVTAAADFKTNGITMPNLLMQKLNTGGTALEDDDITAAVKAAIKTFGLQTVDKKTYEAANTTVDALKTITYADYQADMNRFYAAVLIQQKLDNKMAGSVTGNKALSAETEADWGNGIPAGTTGFLADLNAVTDSLLVGWNKSTDAKPVRLVRPFYIDLTTLTGGTQADFSKEIAVLALGTNKTVADRERVGSETRADYFSNLDSYEYFKGQKLYYRADVANYVSGVSNKITERNMYYVSTGTIQSLGAKSIHDAIYSDQNSMSVNVYVKNWKFSQNDIPM